MNNFITNILNTLKSNGFPEKKVTLPTEKMFEIADSKGFSFNQVLDALREEHKVESEIGPDKIIFSKKIEEAPLSKEEMMKQAQEMMSKMSPEELQKIQEMFTNMTPEQKEEMMKKAKDFGF